MKGTNDDALDYSKSIMCTRNFSIAAIVLGVVSIGLGVGLGIAYTVVAVNILNEHNYYG